MDGFLLLLLAVLHRTMRFHKVSMWKGARGHLATGSLPELVDHGIVLQCSLRFHK